MIWWFYNLLFPVVFLFLLPKYLVRMARRGGYARDFAQRFGRYSGEAAERLRANAERGAPVVWIQAVSVGELAVARSFMAALRERRPDVRFALTTNTSTGYALARKAVQAPDVALYFPVDVPPVVRRVLRCIRPALVVLVENEMWPNLIRHAHRRGTPVLMVNGRISEHSHRGYRKIRFVTRQVLPLVTRFCVQSGGDAARLLDIGARPEAMEVSGSAKYDIGKAAPEAAEKAARVLAAVRPGAGRLVLVAGSTWDGEEAALLDWAKTARARFPQLLLVLVPRHAERRDAVLEAIRASGLPFVQRSKMGDLPTPGKNGENSPDPGKNAPEPAVLLVDTTGELRGFYANADAVFVGKSLTQRGGQNPIEPAVEGKPVVVGPHMENFPVIIEDFRKAGAIVQVGGAAELGEALDRLLGDAAERARIGAAAAALVARQAGATGRMADRAAELLAAGERAP